MVCVRVSPHGACSSRASRRGSSPRSTVRPHRGTQWCLERRERDLAVALREVGITHVEAGALDLHRQEQAAADAEAADVEVAAVRARGSGRRGVGVVAGDADESEERAQREAERPSARRVDASPVGSVDAGQDGDHRWVLARVVRPGKLAREHAPPVPVAHDPVGRPEGEREGLDAQHVARRGAVDADRTDHRVGTVVAFPRQRGAAQRARRRRGSRRRPRRSDRRTRPRRHPGRRAVPRGSRCRR